MQRPLPLAALLMVLLVAGAASATSYNTPNINGHVTVSPDDWDADELAVPDPPDDCRYGTDTDISDLFVTWDADSLYVGFRTDGGPSGFGNGLIVYIDTDAQDGITGATDFTSADFYARRVTFSTVGIDVMIAGWDGGDYIPFEVRDCADPTSTVPITDFFTQWNPGWRQEEIGIGWDGIYGLGPGVVPSGTVLRVIAVTVGGDGSGAFDAVPTTSTAFEADPENDWDVETDLDLYAEFPVDLNGDGVPDVNYPPPGAIAGIVTLSDPADTTTVATVTVYEDGVAVRSGQTAPGGGEYVVGRLHDGTYDVVATAPSYLSSTIEEVEVVDAGTTPGQDFTLQLVTGRIEGEVTLTGDAPAVDVIVTAYDTLGEIGGEGPFVVAGGVGPFSIGTVLDGAYRVLAEGKGYVEAAVDTVVADGDTTNVGLMELSPVVATKYSFVDSLRSTVYGVPTTVSLPAGDASGLMEYRYARAWVEPRDAEDRVAYWDEDAQGDVLLSVTRLDPAYLPQGNVTFADADGIPLTDPVIDGDTFEDGRAPLLVADDTIEVLRVLASRDQLEGVLEVGVGPPEPVELQLASDVDTIDVGGDLALIVGQLKDSSNNDAKVQGVRVDLQALGVGGEFSPGGSPQTDANGRFAVDFGGLTAGVAYVTGVVDQASAYANLPVDTLAFTILPGPPAAVALRANPAALTGGGVSEITARVEDGWGNQVALGGLSIFLAGTPASLVISLDSPIVTNAEGAAAGTLKVGTTYGMLEISGTADTLAVEALFVPIDGTIVATDEQAPESDLDHNSDPGADLTILRAANSADTLVVTHDFYSDWKGVHIATVFETHGDAAGAPNDPFTFPIGYTHELRPDYVFTYKYSDHAGEEYADLRRWSGSGWQFYDFETETWVTDWSEGVRAEGYVTKTEERVSFRIPFSPLGTGVGQTVRLQSYVMQETPPPERVKYNALDSVPHDATHDMLPDEGDWSETATDSVYLSNYAAVLMVEEGLPPELSNGLANPSSAGPGDPVTFTVDVEDAGGGIGDVFIDLSEIGGASLVRMTDDGVPPDATAGDGTYTADYSLTSAASDGEHTLTVTALDAANIWPARLGIVLDVDSPATVLRSFEDEVGDDHGPYQLDSQDVPVVGLYYFYPTNFVFRPGSFDITQVDIFTDGDWVVFRTYVQDLVSHQESGAADWGAPQPSPSTCDNPNRTDMNLQKIDIYIDAREGQGSTAGFPNRFVDVAPVDAWDYGISVEGWGKWFVVSNDSPSLAAWDLYRSDSDIRVCNDHVENYIDVAIDRELLGIEGDEIDEDDMRDEIQRWDIIVCLSSHDRESNDQNLGGIRWVNANTAEWEFGGGRDGEAGRDRDANIIDVAVSPGLGHDAGRTQAEMLDYTTLEAEARFANSQIACVLEASFAEDFSPPIISGFEGDPDVEHVPWVGLEDAPIVFWTMMGDLSGIDVAEFHWHTLGDTADRVVEMVELAAPYWGADLSREEIVSAAKVVGLNKTGPARVVVGKVYARDASANANDIWAGPFEFGVPEPWSDTQTFAGVDSLADDAEDDLFVFQEGTIVVLEPQSLPDVEGPIDLVIDPIPESEVDLDNIRSGMDYVGTTRDIWLETPEGRETALDYLAWLFLHYPYWDVGALDDDFFGLFRWNDETDRWILVGGSSNTAGDNVLNFVSELGRFGVFYWDRLNVGDTDGLAGVMVEPNPFSPNGDGLYEETRVTFYLGREADYVNVEFFDLTGRLVRRLEFQQPASYTGRTPMEIIWNGADEGGNVAPYGLYIMRMEAKFKTAPTYERVNIPVAIIK